MTWRGKNHDDEFEEDLNLCREILEHVQIFRFLRVLNSKKEWCEFAVSEIRDISQCMTDPNSFDVFFKITLKDGSVLELDYDHFLDAIHIGR